MAKRMKKYQVIGHPRWEAKRYRGHGTRYDTIVGFVEAINGTVALRKGKEKYPKYVISKACAHLGFH